jgi:hypothetical protein
MVRRGALGLLIVMAMVLTIGLASPVQHFTQKFNAKVVAYGNQCYVLPFKGHERANVTVVGKGSSYLGLYVFDRHGNCLCADDHAAPPNKDDCAVEWYPSRTESYLIEVRNLGPVENGFVIAMP